MDSGHTRQASAETQTDLQDVVKIHAYVHASVYFIASGCRVFSYSFNLSSDNISSPIERGRGRGW